MTRPYGAECRTGIGRIGAITWIGKDIALLVLPCLATPTKCCTFFNQAYFCEFCNEWELFLGLEERRIKEKQCRIHGYQSHERVDRGSD